MMKRMVHAEREKARVPGQLPVDVGRVRRPRRVAPMPRPEEEALIDRLQSGDDQAFGEFYNCYCSMVERFIRKRVANESEIEDLVQETFLQASRSIARFGRRSRLSTWVLGIARNVCRHYFRSASRWMVGANSMSAPSCEQPEDARIEARVEARRMLDQIEHLIDERRGAEGASIFELRFVEGRSTHEIASCLGKSADAVKMNLRRSRLAIAQHLQDEQHSLEGRLEGLAS